MKEMWTYTFPLLQFSPSKDPKNLLKLLEWTFKDKFFSDIYSLTDYCASLFLSLSLIRKKVSSARCAANPSSVHPRSRHTCLSTPTPGLTPASTVARDFIRNLIWKSTPTYTLVNILTFSQFVTISVTLHMIHLQQSPAFQVKHVGTISRSNITADKSEKRSLNKYPVDLHIWVSSSQRSVKGTLVYICCQYVSDKSEQWPDSSLMVLMKNVICMTKTLGTIFGNVGKPDFTEAVKRKL